MKLNDLLALPWKECFLYIEKFYCKWFINPKSFFEIDYYFSVACINCNFVLIT